VEDTPGAAPFKALYDACDVPRCDVFDPAERAAFSAAMFAAFAACELMDWPPSAQFADHSAWGWPSKRRGTVMQTFATYEGRTLPLDWNAFNAYHHAGKVGQLDLELLQDHVTARERQGKPIPSLRRLIADLPAFRQCASTSRAPAAKRDS
jgi:hypothetical protein